MKILFEKRPQGFFPIHDSDKEKLDRLPNGSLYERSFKMVRNPDFHRLVFGFLNIVFHYQNDYDDFDKFRDRITLLSDSYTEEIMFNAEGEALTVIKLESWSFQSLDEYSFRELFKKVKDICWRHYVPLSDDREEVERQLLELG